MSLTKTSSPSKRDYIEKIFFNHDRLNPGDTFRLTIIKDGKSTTSEHIIPADQMLESARFYITIRDFVEEVPEP